MANKRRVGLQIEPRLFDAIETYVNNVSNAAGRRYSKNAFFVDAAVEKLTGLGAWPPLTQSLAKTDDDEEPIDFSRGVLQPDEMGERPWQTTD